MFYICMLHDGKGVWALLKIQHWRSLSRVSLLEVGDCSQQELPKPGLGFRV